MKKKHYIFGQLTKLSIHANEGHAGYHSRNNGNISVNNLNKDSKLHQEGQSNGPEEDTNKTVMADYDAATKDILQSDNVVDANHPLDFVGVDTTKDVSGIKEDFVTSDSGDFSKSD